jgi:hypothetical protein
VELHSAAKLDSAVQRMAKRLAKMWVGALALAGAITIPLSGKAPQPSFDEVFVVANGVTPRTFSPAISLVTGASVAGAAQDTQNAPAVSAAVADGAPAHVEPDPSDRQVDPPRRQADSAPQSAETVSTASLHKDMSKSLSTPERYQSQNPVEDTDEESKEQTIEQARQAPVAETTASPSVAPASDTGSGTRSEIVVAKEPERTPDPRSAAETELPTRSAAKVDATQSAERTSQPQASNRQVEAPRPEPAAIAAAPANPAAVDQADEKRVVARQVPPPQTTADSGSRRPAHVTNQAARSHSSGTNRRFTGKRPVEVTRPNSNWTATFFKI